MRRIALLAIVVLSLASCVSETSGDALDGGAQPTPCPSPGADERLAPEHIYDCELRSKLRDYAAVFFAGTESLEGVLRSGGTEEIAEIVLSARGRTPCSVFASAAG